MTAVDPDPWPIQDPFGEALHFLHLSGAYYCRSELTAPWGLTLPPLPGYLWFHVVTVGGTWLEAGDGDSRYLRPGDFALVPHGGGHVLRSEPDASAPPILDLPLERVSDRYEILHHGGGGPPTTLICGAVRFHRPIARDVTGLMPDVIHVEAPASLESEWMQVTLRLMATEAAARRPGGETVITRLADVLVIQAIRSWLDRDAGARTGWLGALRDPQIGHALSAIHREPAHTWTVGNLAGRAAMSRSAFAARFTELVGETPIAYVTRRRMHVALGWLSETGMNVSQAAARLGYGSEAAFNRAFKRVIGVPPGATKGTGAGAALRPPATP